MKRKLTSKFIEKCKPNPSKRLDVRDELMSGLVLRVSTSGTKTFCLHKRLNGKMQRLTIGRFPVLSLAEARERVRGILYQVETGQFEDRTGLEFQAKPTLGEVIPDYVENYARVHNRDWKRKEAHLWKLTSLHGKRIDQIKRTDVVRVCDEIKKSSPVGANRALAHLRHLLNWCVERGMIESTPVSGMRAPSKEKPRKRVLSDAELRIIWASSDAEGYPFGDCMKLLTLSGQRRAEVAEMRWSELDLEKRVWTLPPERAKNDEEHQLPLTDAMMTILCRVPKFLESEFVFTTTGRSPISGFGRLKSRLDKTMPKGTPRWTVHDLRRTFATNMAMLGIQQAVTEAILNHTSGVVSGVAATYNVYKYTNEKREALVRWNEHIQKITTPKDDQQIERRNHA